MSIKMSRSNLIKTDFSKENHNKNVDSTEDFEGQQKYTTSNNNKVTPARRLAARQTLKLAIPKFRSIDSNVDTTNTGTIQDNNEKQQISQSTAPILIGSNKNNVMTTNYNNKNHNSSYISNGRINKNINGDNENLVISSPGIMIRKNPFKKIDIEDNDDEKDDRFAEIHSSFIPNSADIKNNNDIFAFNNGRKSESSSPQSQEQQLKHSPIFSNFVELSPSIASTSSTSSPTFERLFSLSPSLRRYQMNSMSEFPDSTTTSPSSLHHHVVSPTSAAAMLENFHKKSGTLSSTSQSTLATNTSRQQNLLNSSSSASSSSVKETSSSQHQVVNSSSTTTRVEKKSSSQRLHHVTSSSSSSSTSEMKATALKRDLSEIKNSMSEINDLAMGRTTQNLGDLKLSSPSSTMSQLQKRIRSSLENLVDAPSEPLVTFPEGEDDSDDLKLDLSPTIPDVVATELTNGHHHHHLPLSSTTGSGVGGGGGGGGTMVDTVKFEEKRVKSESKTKVITDGFSSEQATSNLAEMKRLQAGDIDYKEAKAAAAMRNRLEVDGIKTEQNAALLKGFPNFFNCDPVGSFNSFRDSPFANIQQHTTTLYMQTYTKFAKYLNTKNISN